MEIQKVNRAKKATYMREYRKKNSVKGNAYMRAYQKQRRIDMNTGKIPMDAQFRRQIDAWVEKTFRELQWLDDNRYIRVERRDLPIALSKLSY